jgi:hypothetical protein
VLVVWGKNERNVTVFYVLKQADLEPYKMFLNHFSPRSSQETGNGHGGGDTVPAFRAAGDQTD